MKRNPAWLLSIALALAPAAHAAKPVGNAPEAKAPRTTAVADDPAPAATYDVFIDGVTGYAFIKTPKGWKFVKNLHPEPLPAPKLSMR